MKVFLSILILNVINLTQQESSNISPIADFILPEYALTCKINDPGRDACIKNSIQNMIPYIIDGLPNLNIPPIDPYTLNNTYYEIRQGIVSAKIQIKTSKTFGIGAAQIKDVRTKIDDTGMSSEFVTYFPHIYIEGTYKSEGRLNNFKLKSKGYFNLTFTDITSKHKLFGNYEYKKDTKYLKLNKLDIDILNIGDFKVYANGLFPNPEFNQMVLDFINQYWSSLYHEILPETKAIWEPLFLKEINAFLLRVPFHKMLLLD